MYRVNARLLVFVEIETQHITCRKAEIIKILTDLFLSFGIIARPAPYLQFYNILLPQIIDNNVRSGLISGLGFNIIITCAINDWLQIEQELLSSFFLFESFFQWSKYLKNVAMK